MKNLIYLIVLFGLTMTIQSEALPLVLNCHSDLKASSVSESLVHWQVLRRVSGDDSTGMIETSVQFGHGQHLAIMSRFITRQIMGKSQTIITDARMVPMLQRYSLTFGADFKTSSMGLGEDVPAEDNGEIPLPERMKADFMESFHVDASQAEEWVNALIAERFDLSCSEN